MLHVIPSAPANVPDAALIALGAEHAEADRSKRRWQDANPDADLDACEHYVRDKRLREAIDATPATSFAGLVVKARAAMSTSLATRADVLGPGSFVGLSEGLIADILRLAGGFPTPTAARLLLDQPLRRQGEEWLRWQVLIDTSGDSDERVEEMAREQTAIETAMHAIEASSLARGSVSSRARSVRRVPPGG